MKKLCFFILLFSFSQSWAYSDFIGVGQGSCISCHFNGAGGGPLNDQGRNFYATQLAARSFESESTTENDLKAQSGFLGSSELPWWFRPGYKLKTLNYQEMPGQKNSELKTFNMQSELSFVFSLDPQYKNIIVSSLGQFPETYLNSNAMNSIDSNGLISREHYWRSQIGLSSWVSVGLMDKVFGIRHPDHTSFNRGTLGFGAFDQVYAFQLHNKHEGGEVFIQPYIGNSLKYESQKFSGTSLMYERETDIKNRYGISFNYETNKTNTRERMGVTARLGVGEGSSALFELGKKTDTPKGQQGTTGAYGFAESQILLAQGLYFQSLGEYSKNDVNQAGQENLKWGIGFIYFPTQRFELRLGSMTQRPIDPTGIKEDKWAIQSQLHLSL